MATILSLKSVGNIPGSRITMDTDKGNDIVVTLQDGNVFDFHQYSNGLYYFDTNSTVINKINGKSSNYSLVQTITANKSYFTTQEIKGADTSRKYQEYLYYSSTDTLKHILMII